MSFLETKSFRLSRRVSLKLEMDFGVDCRELQLKLAMELQVSV